MPVTITIPAPLRQFAGGQSQIVVEAKTEDDELLVHPCDLDATIFGKQTIFNFANHRRIEHYGLITSQTGAVPPPEN